MKVIVCKNYDEASQVGARMVASQVTLKPDSVFGLPTGSTPIGTYQNLAKMYRAGELDFSEAKSFNLDEYFPISREHDQSYYYFMHDNFFNHVNFKPENVHILNGTVKDPQKECADYEAAIKEAGGIDFQVLGIGNNGHIGFNEPGAELSSVTYLVTLTENTLEANARFFDSVNDVPKQALTSGMATILKAKKIILIATGANKKEAVKKILSGKITTECPATMLSMHNDVTLIVDEEAYN